VKNRAPQGPAGEPHVSPADGSRHGDAHPFVTYSLLILNIGSHLHFKQCQCRQAGLIRMWCEWPPTLCLFQKHTFPTSLALFLHLNLCLMCNFHDMTFENMILLLFSLSVWVRSCYFVLLVVVMIEKVSSRSTYLSMGSLCVPVFVRVLLFTRLFSFCLFISLQSSYITFSAPCTFWYVISKESTSGQLWAYSWSCILESLYRIFGILFLDIVGHNMQVMSCRKPPSHIPPWQVHTTSSSLFSGLVLEVATMMNIVHSLPRTYMIWQEAYCGCSPILLENMPVLTVQIATCTRMTYVTKDIIRGDLPGASCRAEGHPRSCLSLIRSCISSRGWSYGRLSCNVGLEDGR